MTEECTNCLKSITSENINRLKILNNVIFPVYYNEKFYMEMMKAEELAKLAYRNNVAVGAVCCRIDVSNKSKRLYIVTLGVLYQYRRLGIGTMLLQHILNYVEKNKKFSNIFLHVQVGNDEAINFYKTFGFEIVETQKDYYRRLQPADAYVLQKNICTVA